MKSALHLVVAGLLATAAQAQAQPVEPGERFPWQQLEVKAPASPGWVLVSATRQGLAFMRRSDELARSEVATVSVFRLPDALDSDAFQGWVEQAVQAESPPSRFRPIEAASEHDAERGYACVVHRSLTQDLQARGVPAGTQAYMQQQALYCRHPTRVGTGFAVAFSTRGAQLDPTLPQRARSFFDGVVASVPQQSSVN